MTDPGLGTEKVAAVPAADPDKIRALYAPQLEGAESLLETIWSNRPDGVEIADDGGAQIVLVHLFGRATQSYRAVLSLCEAGLPDQALMICRSLYEDMIATHWARLEENRDGLVAKVVRQERHWDERQDRITVGRGGVVAPSAEEPMSEDEWNRLDAEFSGGTKSWFGKLSVAVRRVYEVVDDKERWWLRLLGEEFNAVANMTLHTTVEGLKSGVSRPLRYQGKSFMSYETWRTPDERRMRAAFLVASECYGRIAIQVMTEFDKDPAIVKERLERLRVALFRLLPSQRREVGRNDPCWCGSGLKLKRCHGGLATRHQS